MESAYGVEWVLEPQVGSWLGSTVTFLNCSIAKPILLHIAQISFRFSQSIKKYTGGGGLQKKKHLRGGIPSRRRNFFKMPVMMMMMTVKTKKY